MKLAFSFLIFLSALVSCQGEKEDQALVEKYEEQQVIIEGLDAELRKVKMAIEDADDPAPALDFKGLKGEIKEASEKREALEDEVKALEAKKKKAEADLKRYQEKYPIRNQ